MNPSETTQNVTTHATTQKAYLGITGYKTAEEVAHTVEQFSTVPMAYTAMVGVNSPWHKLQSFVVGDSNNAEVEKISCVTRSVRETAPWMIPMLHYYAPSDNLFADTICRIADTTTMRAVQLNVAWPRLSEVAKLRREGITTTFQLASDMIATPDLSTRISEYAPFVDYALLDMSSGKGVSFDESQSEDLLQMLHSSLPNVQLGIAGGLDASCVFDRVSALRARTGLELCVDAQKRLASNGSLDLDKVRSYIVEARRLWETK